MSVTCRNPPPNSPSSPPDSRSAIQRADGPVDTDIGDAGDGQALLEVVEHREVVRKHEALAAAFNEVDHELGGRGLFGLGGRLGCVAPQRRISSRNEYRSHISHISVTDLTLPAAPASVRACGTPQP